MSERTTERHPTLQAALLDQLRQGVGRWIEPETATHWSHAIEGEWDRVVLWRGRVNPDTGRNYSYLEAARVVSENPPSFDRVWLDAFGEGRA